MAVGGAEACWRQILQGRDIDVKGEEGNNKTDFLLKLQS